MLEKYVGDQRFIYLNRHSALPLYYQLKEHMKDAILKGHYKPNDRLPTEDELCKQFSISRPVVRQAYDELIKERLIERRKGSGTFVRQQNDKNTLFKEFLTFSYEKTIKDVEANSKIVKIDKIVDENINKKLSLEKNSEVLHIIRVTHEHEYPVSMVESYLPCQYFINIQDYMLISITKTIIDLIETMYGIHIIKAKRTLTPQFISEERAAFLHGKSEELIYEIETKYYDGFDRLILLEYVSYLTSKVKFTVDLSKK